MHWIDILVILTLLISGAFAYARGFVHEILSIAGWIGAAFGTIYGTPLFKPFARQFIETPFIADLVTGIVIFIGILVILSFITKRISKGVKESALGALDRALGFLFGLLRGALVVSLVWIGYEWMTPPKERPETIFTARTLPLVMQGAEMLKFLVPPSQEDQNSTQDPNADPNAAPGPGAAPQDGNPTLLDKAIRPVPKAPDQAPSNGYGRKERSEMDRLFETSK